MSPETPDRWATTATRGSLARRFGLPFDHSMQDWEWEVADARRFDELVDAYSSGSLDEDERFTLMEMLIQCVEEMDLPSVESSRQWRAISSLLQAHARLHASLVRYWSCLEDDRGLEDCFRVTGPMRAIWRMVQRADEECGDSTHQA